jgi:hypothetical protein
MNVRNADERRRFSERGQHRKEARCGFIVWRQRNQVISVDCFGFADCIDFDAEDGIALAQNDDVSRWLVRGLIGADKCVRIERGDGVAAQQEVSLHAGRLTRYLLVGARRFHRLHDVLDRDPEADRADLQDADNKG